MADLYRKSAIEKLSSVERTDKTMAITSPLSWLALIGITIIVAVTVVWAFLGTIPITVSGKGIVASPTSTNAIFLDENGTVVSIVARKGVFLEEGDTVMTYRTSNEKICTLVSTQRGVVSDVLVSVGDSVKQGSEVVRISPVISGSNQVVVSYVSLAESKKIERGMDVQVYLDSADSQTYGHMWARVINIDTHATTTEGMQYVLGSDNYLSSTIQNSEAVAAVTCEFYLDDTVSGFDWTNEKGGELRVTNGSSVTVKIIVDEVKPIEKMFSKLSEIWGD